MKQKAKVHKNKKSLCEKSMLLVANIIKLSYAPLASFSFGTSVYRSPVAAEKEKPGIPDGVKVATTKTLLVPQRPRRPSPQLHQELVPEKTGSRPYSSLVETHKDIDGRATDFIRWKHQTIVSDHDDLLLQNQTSKSLV